MFDLQAELIEWAALEDAHRAEQISDSDREALDAFRVHFECVDLNAVRFCRCVDPSIYSC